MASISYLRAFQVVYTVQYPWHKASMQRLFDTFELAKEFHEPLEKAARQAGEFHNMPSIREVGILQVDDCGHKVRYLLGPSADMAFISSIAAP